MGFIFKFILCVALLSSRCALTLSHSHKGKICIGTNGRMSVPSNRDHHYRNLRDRYNNCTYVDGNLELTWLQDETLDLSFLKYIREVTGYVLISHVNVKRVVFPSLQIIRGRTLFKLNVADENFALLVMLSKMDSVEMPALRDILKGSVSLFNNYNLCHVKSINWTEIISDPSGNYTYTYNFTQPQRMCRCDDTCKRGCWGDGPENCQKFSKITCSPQCHDGRCYGPGPRDCCHLFCAGGCTGPTQSDCLACHNFYDDGLCKQECPQMKTYNSITYSWEMNPEGKYAYGATCVKDCPGHLLKDSGACVRSCPSNKMAEKGECVLCNGPCPKTCLGVRNVHSGNIDSFRDCTIIDGSLTILDHSFDGFQDMYKNFSMGATYPEMHPSKLDVFSTLKEITGYISIQASHPEFTSLSFLRNLEFIGGRELTEYFSSLYVVKTTLKSLGLRSLKRIRAGSVSILENNELCYAEKINWKRLTRGDKTQLLLQNNRQDSQCRQEEQICHSECSKDGCWDIGQDQCLSCRNFRLGEKCINNCSLKGIYEKSPNECALCDLECEGGCNGSGPKQCRKCKNVKDGPYCAKKCPGTKFNDNGICKNCHSNCVGGCSGPANNIGPNGCNSCEKAVINRDNNVDYCLSNEDSSCPMGYYSEWFTAKDDGHLRSITGKTICSLCHPLCKNCTGYGAHSSVCHKCSKYLLSEECVAECSKQDHYVDEIKKECSKCSSECSEGCSGPTDSACVGCRNYRIYNSGTPHPNNTDFRCTASCSGDLPYKVFPDDLANIHPYCSKEQLPLSLDDDSMTAIMGGSLGCLFLLAIFFSVLCFLWWQRNKTKEAALKMTMTMMPHYDDNEPLKPTNIKPNLAKLRIVKEAELRRGGILGYGAFGTVYKGVWVPEGENVKIPVAIKVLREGTGTNVNKEILEEAYIMASVDHPNLLQLLAVCMTTQIMLVTQLMPLGCLLDYVRNNKDKVGSKPLLNWCTQIARGMHYLEERRLVHRDLAARNVLVQTPNCVKITDFGLAKLLDYNEDEYKAAGGKMPIKWLALECIQHRTFTHKSDVWSFGVTVWEILTYGGRPYEDIPAREVPDLLEKGERLPQPAICTIDVFMLILRCWTLKADGRPSFQELSENFAKLSADPGRYLVIPGDKLMRLPSYTPQDERELIRCLSSAIEGDGVIMAAEEYLHPKYGGVIRPHAGSASTPSEPATPVNKYAPNSISGGFSTEDFHHGGVSESPQNLRNLHREKKYAHLEAMHNGQLTNGQRYCSDPLKMLDNEMGDDDCFEPEIPMRLDEDDYLIPSRQLNGAPNQHYMDFGTDENDPRFRQREGSYGLTGPNSGQWGAMDNPEYHLFNRTRASYSGVNHLGPAHHQAVGVPVVHNKPNCYVAPTIYNGNAVGFASHPAPFNMPPTSYSTQPTVFNVVPTSYNSPPMSYPSTPTSCSFPQQPSSLPISRPPDHAHEYYNEIPRLPSTPRSETTV